MSTSFELAIDWAITASAGNRPMMWSEELALALVEHSADIILVLTADHICLFANPAVCDRLGYDPEDLLGKDVISLHHPDDLPRAGEMLASAAAYPGFPAKCEVRLRHQDGSWRWMEIVATNRLADPAIQGIVCNLRDVTERTEAAIAAQEALQQQEAARRELEHLTHAKSSFLRLLGHEFKTPLTVIAGNADLLEMEEAGSDGLLESARAIRGEAHRLARLIDDLLLLDRMEATRLMLRRDAVDINALVVETVNRMRTMTPHREFHFQLEMDLLPVHADRERIVQMIVNLVGNAIKYSPDGEPITISTAREGATVSLSVSDRGIGIAAEDLPTLFERYRRARSGEMKGISGTGLGLAIVRELAQLHGGETWAESVEGEGSTFFIRLPAEAGE